ncbi:MAG TPA: protease pro-enzyme activation domain-containing protein, partial [Candidatus Aquilonibacter sp.]|nr:protease pro-enzyme activation domain-containing protein [Candidatus Aquilonibacter sp.]
QDLTAVTTWLGSHGFQVNQVSAGRDMIDFSGNAGEIQEAFHTEIHNYLINGQMHYANASDPEIPAALSPVIAGVRTLNDFRPKPMHQNLGQFKMAMPNRKVSRVSPQFTYTGLASNNTICYETSASQTSSPCYAVGAYDFATIYNLQLPLWNAGYTGTGETIAVVSDSNINTADYVQFRQVMGLPPQTVNPVYATGVNPGIQSPSCTLNNDEEEAILDVEWAGATAPGAAIDLVMAPSPSSYSCGGASTTGEGAIDGYTSNFGGDYAAYYEINLPNPDPILSDSYGECELNLTAAGNMFYNSLWLQANTEGITVLAATGDNGSAGCDNDEPSSPTPAQEGLQVNGTASTPYDTAVGGTDFNYSTASAAGAYWSSTNTTSGTSATLSADGPIPETAYNDSCTNPVIIQALEEPNAVSACNGVLGTELEYLIDPAGGSGGASSCTTTKNGGEAPSDCAVGYSKPPWQTGTGVPNDGARDIPDLSLFAGDGTASGTFYIVCEQDEFSPPQDCTLPQTSQGDYYFVGEGGTSVSTQAMAGIVAVLDQYHNNHYGSVAFNQQLYTLAGQTPASSCNNSGTTAVADSSSCIFRDVTAGNNAMPCVVGDPSCGTSITSRVVPVARPWIEFRWTPLGIATLVCTLCAATLLFLLPPGRRRWSAALALVLFAVVFGTVSCGGGGGSGTVTGGGGSSNTVGVLQGYGTGVGYDRATGLGSINAANLIKANGW